MQFVDPFFGLECAIVQSQDMLVGTCFVIKVKEVLGFRSLVHWNMALIGKQAWSIAMKADNL